MEIKTLRYFLAIAREENMTRAAAFLHVTQPTLSKQMKSLEDELGKKLFTRHSFSIRLTDEGILLKNRAEDLVSLANKIEQEFISLDDITGGDLYLGLAESSQLKYLAQVIKAFKRRYPNLHYHITSGDTEQIADKLDNGLLDFLVLAEYPDGRKYESIEFPESDKWGLVIPTNDPLAKKKKIRVTDLIGLPLFCSEQAWDHEIKEWAGASFSKLKLEGSFRLAYNGSIFTREGLGYLLTFDHLIDTSEDSGLVFRPLEPAAETKLFIVWNRYQTFTPIAERFLKQLRTTLQIK
ncbi:LysR family transcriptional regulator [Pseudoramibacter sp.]|jgi:DNA-binding transcriptional LysR family regulator|uniref:LysR family transcriptional regulator n=1 Tax=Pseudoramibacter sp. TaxID=2034862 RepID=UPI0025D0AD40|nr:LysR family transcriptional regulator [Pseudoramibacter sp.]MCH4073058.1 LysR family transcriptional regulator [Pseudoramibacter sp.]MCH4106829.1 LysR family transcriptional regulator [Pseudoramibacter sp.]